MRSVRCCFYVDVPEEATEKEIEAWLRFELHESGGLLLNNPMAEMEIEAKNVSVTLY